MHEFSVLRLTETWLAKDTLTDFPLPNYRDTKRGGGVGLYVNKSLQFTERKDLSMNIENTIKAQFIEINSHLNNIIIGVIYRPPSDAYDQFEEKLLDVLQIINRENKKCFFDGRF